MLRDSQDTLPKGFRGRYMQRRYLNRGQRLNQFHSRQTFEVSSGASDGISNPRPNTPREQWEDDGREPRCRIEVGNTGRAAQDTLIPSQPLASIHIPTKCKEDAMPDGERTDRNESGSNRADNGAPEVEQANKQSAQESASGKISHSRVEQRLARQPHKLEVDGSTPSPAPNF